MKDLFVYEIVAGKSGKAVEFGLLTENGIPRLNKQATVFESRHELVIHSSEEDVCLKDVSPEILLRLKNGAQFLVLDLSGDSANYIETVFKP